MRAHSYYIGEGESWRARLKCGLAGPLFVEKAWVQLAKVPGFPGRFSAAVTRPFSAYVRARDRGY